MKCRIIIRIPDMREVAYLEVFHDKKACSTANNRNVLWRLSQRHNFVATYCGKIPAGTQQRLSFELNIHE